MKEKDLCCNKQPSESKEIDIPRLNTARFGRVTSNNFTILKSKTIKNPEYKKKRPVKQSFVKLKPKVSAYKPKQKIAIRQNISHSSRAQLISHKPLQINLNLESSFNYKDSSQK